MGSVTDYVAGLDEPARTLLGRLYRRALVIAPDAEEGTSYGLAALRHRGRPLVAVQVTKAGYSAYPFSPAVVQAVMATIDGFEGTKGGIRFTDANPLPDSAYDALVTGRRDEIDEALSRR